MFFLKKLIGPLLFPVPVCLLLLAVGLGLLWLTRRQRTGKMITSAGALLLALLCFDCGPGALLEQLERQYPPFELTRFDEARREQLRNSVKWIVVLGGAYASDPDVPATSRVAGSSLTRLVEGLRLKRQFPQAKLLLSGAQVYDSRAVADGMSEVAQNLGVGAEEIALDLRARDTEEEARVIGEMIGRDQFIMVTSAGHMPRAMALFRRAGLEPIPAPTEHIIKHTTGAGPADYVPSSGGLMKTERALYEYLGLGWAKLRGRI